MNNSDKKSTLLAKNKRARFDYEVTDTLEVGIVLRGHEVKAIKAGQVNLTDAVVLLQDNELWIHHLDIPLYKLASHAVTTWYEPKWRRKLLLHTRELRKWLGKISRTKQNMIPLDIYMNPRHRIKLTIGLAKRKKKVEKRSALREKDTKRQMDREMSKRR